MASSGSMGGGGKSVVESDEADRVNPKRPGRRKSKGIDQLAAGQKIKKTPQRGMGVAELERLRLQDQMGSSVRTPPPPPPFTISDQSTPVEVPAIFPPGFGPTAGYYNNNNNYNYNYNYPAGFVVGGSHGNHHVMIPGYNQNPNPFGYDHFPHQNLREYLGSRKSMEFPSIPTTPVFKMKRVNGYHDFLLNKSTNENVNKGMVVVEHQFFPTEIMGSSSTIEQNDDHTTMFFTNDSNTTAIDLSLKL